MVHNFYLKVFICLVLKTKIQKSIVVHKIIERLVAWNDNRFNVLGLENRHILKFKYSTIYLLIWFYRQN